MKVGPWWMKAAYFKGPKPSPAHQPGNAAKSQPSWSCSYPAEEADGGLAAFLRGSVMCLGYSSHHEAQNKRWKAETGACRMANVVTWSCCSCKMGGVGRGFIKLLLRLFDRPEGTCSAALANVIRFGSKLTKFSILLYMRITFIAHEACQLRRRHIDLIWRS